LQNRIKEEEPLRESGAAHFLITLKLT